MGAGTSRVIVVVAALSQVHLCPCTSHIAVPDWTTASSKGSRPRSSHSSQVPQLMANDRGISKIPVGIAHSSPLSKEEHLNTPFCCIVSFNHSESTYCNCVIYCNTCKLLYINTKYNCKQNSQQANFQCTHLYNACILLRQSTYITNYLHIHAPQYGQYCT